MTINNPFAMKKVFLALLVLLLAACEKAYEETSEEKPAEGANVVLRMVQFEQIA